MSCTITADITFPTTLPLPFHEYGGQPVNSSIMSNEQTSPLVRRQRFTRSYAGLAVQWVLTRAQFTVFKDFFTTDLGNGIAHFQIELRYPYNNQLTNWIVRFVAGYNAEHSDGFFTVQADLDLVNPVTEPDMSILIVSNESSALHGTYHRITDTYWEQEAPADYGIRFSEVNDRWEIYELIFPDPIWFFISANEFPHGTWTAENGSHPMSAAYQ